jgi:transcriptional regulator with XRE-family HTH domain
MKAKTSHRAKRARYSWKACAHRLKVTRIALGISESEAATAHDVTVATYRKYEAGAPQRASYGWRKFAEKYNVSFDWLVSGVGAGLAPHLSKNMGGKVAILPVVTARRRQIMARVAADSAKALG